MSHGRLTNNKEIEMALPKIKHIIFDIKIPSTGKNVKFRPFTVQEEKIIIMASNSDDPNDVLDAIVQVINNCAVDEDFDVKAMALFDIEWVFIRLRSNSVNNVVDLSKTEDGTTYTGQIDLSKVKVMHNVKHNKKIKINDEIGVIMRYPSIDMIKELKEKSNGNIGIEGIAYCIDKVYTDDEVYTRGDNFTDEELDEFVSSLPTDALQNINEFFDTMPVVTATVTLTAKNKEEKTFELRGLEDFF